MKRLLLFLILAVCGCQAQTQLLSTTITGTVTSAPQQIALASVTGVSAGQILYVDNEAMLVNNLLGRTVRVTRGFAGTRANSHISGSAALVGSTSAFISFDPSGSCSVGAGMWAYTPVVNLLNGNQWVCTAGEATLSAWGTGSATSSGASSTAATLYLPFTLAGGTATFCPQAATTPCPLAPGNTLYTVSIAPTVKGSTGTANDTLEIYETLAGVFTVGYNSANTYTVTNATGASGIAAMPAQVLPLATCTVTSGVITGCAPAWSALSDTFFQASGLGVDVVPTSGVNVAWINKTPRTNSASTDSLVNTDAGRVVRETYAGTVTISLPQGNLGGNWRVGSTVEIDLSASTTATLTIAGATITTSSASGLTTVTGLGAPFFFLTVADAQGDWLLTTPPSTISTPFAPLTDSASVTWNVANTPYANASLALNHATSTRSLNMQNLQNGGVYTLVLQQDATGGAAITLGTGCTWKVAGGGAGAVTLTGTANSRDAIAFTFDGTYCYVNFRGNYN